MLFEKRITIYKKKDREGWQQRKAALEQEKIEGIRSGHYFAESLCAGGCGSKLDPRDFGGKGKIDREIYFIQVKQSQEEKALEAFKKHGLEPEVDEYASMDAEVRLRMLKKKEQDAAEN